ncbi:MAG: hypothetical protein DMG05_29770 [Acidobacteria bacterium]|nr:MAG: hypothetical protein DMG05_29770 [Acidobacteriota bacterium]
MDEFISEDDLRTFEGWLRYQAVDASMLTEDELANWRRIFDEARQRSAANPKVGLMKLQPVPGEHRYGFGVRGGASFSSCCRWAIETGTHTQVTISTAPAT